MWLHGLCLNDTVSIVGLKMVGYLQISFVQSLARLLSQGESDPTFQMLAFSDYVRCNQCVVIRLVCDLPQVTS